MIIFLQSDAVDQRSKIMKNNFSAQVVPFTCSRRAKHEKFLFSVSRMKRTQKSLFRAINRTRVTVAPQTLKLQGRILQVTYYTHANYGKNVFGICAVPLQNQVHSYREPLIYG